MTTEEFDAAVRDIVNYLDYTGEPYKSDRQRIGVYVLLFLVVLFVFTWLLGREYNKEVPRDRRRRGLAAAGAQGGRRREGERAGPGPSVALDRPQRGITWVSFPSVRR